MIRTDLQSEKDWETRRGGKGCFRVGGEPGEPFRLLMMVVISDCCVLCG